MPVKIIELPPATQLKNADVIPASQIYSGNRDTYSLTLEQLTNFVNTGPYAAIESLRTSGGGDLTSQINALKSYVNTNFVHLSGDTMTGSLDLSGANLKRFSANIVKVTGNTLLNQTHNGCIILVEKTPRSSSDDRVEIQIAQNTLPIGFNVLLIQTGETQVKVTCPLGGVLIKNPDSALSTRQTYSQINLCMIDTNLVWVTGDMV